MLLKVGDRLQTMCLLEHFWFKWDRKLVAKWLKQKETERGRGNLLIHVKERSRGRLILRNVNVSRILASAHR